MTNVKVVRLTRHAPSREQIEALGKVYPCLEIETIQETLPSNPFEAVKRFDELVDASMVVEVVLPINLIEAILKHSEFAKQQGILIRSVMVNRTIGDGEPNYDFERYEIIESVEVVTRPLVRPQPKEKTVRPQPPKERVRW